MGLWPFSTVSLNRPGTLQDMNPLRSKQRDESWDSDARLRVRGRRGEEVNRFMDVVTTRLHIRRYCNQTISRESIRALLQAAMAAHSEGDERPWHFVVVEDLAMRKRIVETHPTAHIVVQAPVVILVCGDPTLQKHPGFWVRLAPPQPRIS